MPHAIYLIRHPAVALSGVCYGRSDVALAEPVGRLAAELKTQLPQNFTLISSPLSRCRLLAHALGTPRLEPRLMEIDFGAWEMRPWDAIERSQIDAWAADPMDFRGHGGESVAHMAQRALAALQDALANTPADLVIVSHGGPLRAMLGRLMNLPSQEWRQLEFAPGELRIVARPVITSAD